MNLLEFVQKPMVLVDSFILVTGSVVLGVLILIFGARSIAFTAGFTERERNDLLKKMGLVVMLMVVPMLVMEAIYDLVFLQTVLSGKGGPLFVSVLDALKTFFASIPTADIPIPPTPTRKP